jgi:D-alanyl-D-alanine carboxypeptidase
VGRIDALAKSAVAEAPFLGLAVAVERKGHVLFEKGYGFTDLARRAPVTPDTTFALGSLTKQFTAVAVLQLVDQKRLTLEDSVGTYVPSFRRTVTIGQLLQQTAGVAEYAVPESFGKTTPELLATIATSPPDFPPGEKFAYSNANYYLLGRVLAKVHGRPYAEVVDALARQAGLRATHYCTAPDGAHGSEADGATLASEEFDVSFYDAAGALCGSVTDLVRWQHALSGNELLSPASRAYRTTPPALAGSARLHYAAGVLVDTFEGHRRVWHNGAVPGGFESRLTYFPDDEVVIALATNTIHGPPGEALGKLSDEIARVALAASAPAAP